MDLFQIILSLVILIGSAILHEIAHGLVADRLGDPTARLAGRLTLDPRKHIDPMMSIIFPALLILSGSPVIFGAAKPVPVDEFNLREGRKDMALVALAGPATNILIAIIASVLIRLFTVYPLNIILIPIMQINLLLAIFNLLPIPPLDGSRVFSMLLPAPQARAYLNLGSMGFIIIFLLLLMPLGPFSLTSIMYHILTFLQNILLPIPTQFSY